MAGEFRGASVRIAVGNGLKLLARLSGAMFAEAKLGKVGSAGAPAGRTEVSRVRTAWFSCKLAFWSCWFR